MKPASHDQDKQCIFDSFCKTVLRNEVRNYYAEVKRLRDKEISLSDISAQELVQLSTMDTYFATEHIFDVVGNDVFVSDIGIAEALRNLPERNRDIILLYYFLDLSDDEIGKKLNMIRSTVQYRRTNTLQKLKKIMEEEAHEHKKRNSGKK